MDKKNYFFIIDYTKQTAKVSNKDTKGNLKTGGHV